jgi:hypothetical protein
VDVFPGGVIGVCLVEWYQIRYQSKNNLGSLWAGAMPGAITRTTSVFPSLGSKPFPATPADGV